MVDFRICLCCEIYLGILLELQFNQKNNNNSMCALSITKVPCSMRRCKKCFVVICIQFKMYFYLRNIHFEGLKRIKPFKKSK